MRSKFRQAVIDAHRRNRLVVYRNDRPITCSNGGIIDFGVPARVVSALAVPITISPVDWTEGAARRGMDDAMFSIAAIENHGSACAFAAGEVGNRTNFEQNIKFAALLRRADRLCDHPGEDPRSLEDDWAAQDTAMYDAIAEDVACEYGDEHVFIHETYFSTFTALDRLLCDLNAAGRAPVPMRGTPIEFLPANDDEQENEK